MNDFKEEKKKMDKRISEYMESDQACPLCKSSNTENEENEPDDDEIWVDVRCLDCGARWGEGYRLISCQGPITMYSFSQLRMYSF